MFSTHYRSKILKVTYKQKSPGKEFTQIQDGMECAPKSLHKRTGVIPFSLSLQYSLYHINII